MRQRQQHHRPRPTSLSALLLLGATSSSLFSTPASAVPYPKDDLHALGFGYLMPRQCNQYCGVQNQYCCSAGSTCTTQAGIALCAAGAAGGGGGWAVYTTTWTETETFTSTISSHWAPATTAPPAGGGGGDCVPEPGSGWIACGPICCASNQYCAWQGQCLPNVAGGGGGGGGVAPPPTTVITTDGHTITTQYSAPYRVTGDTTVTQTTSGTGVLASQTGTSSAGNGTVTGGGTAGHLSAGAIAGIVIGVLAGVALLLLICACFLVRGLWHGLLALLGLGGGRDKRRRHSETVIEEERYSRHGHSRPASVHSRRDTHSGWFGGGGRPSNVSSRKEKKKSGGGFGWLGLGAAAGTLLLLLGMRRDKKRQQNSRRPVKTRSDVSSSYFGSDSYTASSPSSGSRRTRDSRHSRATRTTRHSRPPSQRP